MDPTFTSDDLHNVQLKLTEASYKYDPQTAGPDSSVTKAFGYHSLSYLEFRDTLKRIFLLHFTNLEFSALVTQLDPKRSNNIPCTDFLLMFIKV